MFHGMFCENIRSGHVWGRNWNFCRIKTDHEVAKAVARHNDRLYVKSIAMWRAQHGDLLLSRPELCHVAGMYKQELTAEISILSRRTLIYASEVREGHAFGAGLS